MKKIEKTLIILIILFSFFCINVNAQEFDISKMTLEEKIAQMLFVQYRSDDYNEEFYETIKKYNPGGFIIYKENINSVSEITEVINRLQEDAKTPIFIGVDQEGGIVQRFSYMEDAIMVPIPYACDIGKKDNKIYTTQVAHVMASELRQVGINVDFAPVLDLYNKDNTSFANYTRSFTSDPKKLSEYSNIFIKVFKNNNIVASPKHFPGVGDASIDSHLTLSYIKKTKKELENNELVPFKDAIKEDMQMMMLSHSIVPDITGNYPFTVSKDGVDYIRKDLGYNGLIITDAINMNSLTLLLSSDNIFKYAINAGIDIILSPPKLDYTIETIKELVENNEIDEKTIDKAVTKILKLKSKTDFSIYEPKNPLEKLNSNYHKMLVYHYPWKEYTHFYEFANK